MFAFSVSSVFEKQCLSNGITILVDHDQRFRSVAFCLCLRGGLLDEAEGEEGITHFLEHLLFKRTHRSDSQAIALRIDEMGSEINAFTDTDSLCLYGVVPAGRLSILMEFLAELVLESNFQAKDLEREREIIRQEILETADNPPDIVSQSFSAALWPDSIMRFPVFGTLESVGRFTLDEVQARLRKLCVGSRIIFTAAGNVDVATVRDFAEKHFSQLPAGDCPKPIVPRPKHGVSTLQRPFQQVYLTFAQPWPGVGHEDYLAGLVFSEIMGRGMASRLFQLLREKHGVAYDVGCDVESFGTTGLLTISSVLEPHRAAQATDLIIQEMEDIRKNSVTKKELERVCLSLSAQIEMGQDSLGGRLWRALEGEISLGRYISADEMLGRIQGLTISDVSRLVANWVHGSEAALMLGGEVENILLTAAVKNYCSASESALSGRHRSELH